MQAHYQATDHIWFKDLVSNNLVTVNENPTTFEEVLQSIKNS